MTETAPREIIIVKRRDDHEEGHHGGAWKIALADFMTAMMALFLVLWLINGTTKLQKQTIVEYFNPVRLAEMTPDRKGLLDPQGSSPGGGEGEGGVRGPDGQEGGKDEAKGALKAASEARPGEPGSRTRESALFQDPYAVLAHLAAEADRTAAAPSEAGVSEAGLPGVSGGEAARDPFDPLYWQVAALPRPRSEQPGPIGTVAPAPVSAALDARAPVARSGPAREARGKELLAKDMSGKDVPGKEAKVPPAQLASADPGALVLAPPPPKPVGLEPAKDAAKAIAGKDASDAAAAVEIKAEIARAVEPLGTGAAAPRIEVRRTGEGVLISVTDAVNFSMFGVGSAEPMPKVVRALERIARVIAARPGRIVVRGHTDGRPFRSETYDNWRLSSARAQMASYMLVRGGVDDGRLERIEGYADRLPRNAADPRAAENRRIEILLRAQPE